MERKPRRPNPTEQLLSQGQTEPENTVRKVSAVVERVIDRTQPNGKKFQTVEYTDDEGQGRSINVFNPHLIEDLKSGDAVDFNLKKSKSGWWNLDSVGKGDEFDKFFDEKPTIQPVLPEMPKTIFQEKTDEKAERERIVKSLTSMTAAATVFSSLVNAGVIKPASYEDAMGIFETMHTQMMGLHQPNGATATKP